MTTKHIIGARTSVAHAVDPAQRAAFPVAVINNGWAPTLAFAFSLGRQNVPLHFYGPGAGRWSRYCRRHATCPPIGHADSFLPWLQTRLRSGEIARLAPTTDLIAYYMAVLREDFSAEVRRTIAPLAEIERSLLKTRFSDACRLAGQQVPSQAAPDDTDSAVSAARALGYPLMIKPKSHLVVGSTERGRLIRNESELRKYYRPYPVASGQARIAAHYPELRWPLLQRYLPTARRCVYSVSGIKDADGGILAAILTCKRGQWPPDVGVSTVQSLCNDDRILAAGLGTVDKLISRGIFELELLIDGDQLLAIDLNPRAFGFMTLDMAAGNDLPWLWWQTTINTLEPTNAPSPPRELECRFIVPYYFGQAIHKVVGPRSIRFRDDVTSPKIPWVSMLGHRSDPVPMLLANLGLLQLLPHRGGLLRPYIAAAWRARKQNK
jgi:predicted ATP-grasp superfamily ATP-dependent carboligase